MEPIKIDITILQSVEKVWEYMNDPKHIVKWNFVHESWHCPRAENDLKAGGILKTRMEAKGKSYGFDIIAIYDEIIPLEKIKCHLEDGRNVEVLFDKIDARTTNVKIIFDLEAGNSREMQRENWYSVLNIFHKYAERH